MIRLVFVVLLAVGFAFPADAARNVALANPQVPALASARRVLWRVLRSCSPSGQERSLCAMRLTRT